MIVFWSLILEINSSVFRNKMDELDHAVLAVGYGTIGGEVSEIIEL